MSDPSTLDSNYSYYDVYYYDYGDCDFAMNFTAEEAIEYSYDTLNELYVRIFLPVIFTLGVLSNLAFLCVVYNVKRMRTATNCCLTNLAVADVMFLVGSVGSKLVKYANSPVSIDDSSLGRAGCIVMYLISDTAYIFSLAAITLVSFEKFYAVCCAHQALGDSRRRVFVRLLVASWIVAFCVAASFIPCTMEYVTLCSGWPSDERYRSWPSQIAFCGPVDDWAIVYGSGAQAIPFLLIFPVNVYLYFRIIVGITRAIKDTSIAGRRQKNIRQRNQIAVMLIVNGAVFFICLAPFEMISLFYMIAYSREEPVFILPADTRQSLTSSARLLAYINAAINPFVYTCMSAQYRDAFRQTFGLGCCSRPGTDAERESVFKRMRRISVNLTASTSAGGSMRIYHSVRPRNIRV
ncbi:neuropeptides capa receptor-like [Patiria miniata]|uniref:G-protein coupled receptors family 1 profile domain-containing protein n=1 Tax=Patiria miniata TaxID=46514 RepID=A0A914AGE6_PATMI|nr:neuropeptides capa receptor-like [Patiria miniata]